MECCKFCKRPMDISNREYLSNPFCGECYEDRLEASGTIDLRDNYRILNLDNGYIQVVPIDPNKKFIKSE